MRALVRSLACSALLAGLLCGSAAAAPLPPGEGSSGLAVIPAQAPIVLSMRGVERTKDRLNAFLKAAVPDFGPIASAAIDSFVANGIEGRAIKGLGKEGPVFVAFLEMPAPGNDNPSVALIARVQDYKAFRDGLLTEDERKNVKADPAGFERGELNSKEMFFLERQGFAVLTPSKDAASMLAKKQGGLDGKLEAGLAQKLLANDLGIYVNLAAVNKQYGEMIKEGRKTFEQLLDSVPGGGTEKSSMEMAKSLYGAVFTAVEDGRGLVLGLDFRPEGLNMSFHIQVGGDTPTGAKLKDSKPSRLADLQKMPAGMMTYSATEFSPSLFKSLAPMLYGVLGAEGENRKKLETIMDAMASQVQSATYSASNIPAAGVQLQEAADPSLVVKSQMALYQSMSAGGTFQSTYLKGKPEVKENVQEYRGFKFNFAKFVWDLDKFAEAIPGGGEGVKAALKKLTGESIQVWFGTNGKLYLNVTAKDWDDAKRRIDQVLDGKSTLGATAPFQATRKQLPEEANLIMLFDAGRMAFTMGDYMLAIFKAMPGLPFNLPDAMKPVETQPSYIGGTIALRPEHMAGDLFIPVTAIQEIRKVLMPLLGGAQ